jgi:hypothetical protein
MAGTGATDRMTARWEMTNPTSLVVPKPVKVFHLLILLFFKILSVSEKMVTMVCSIEFNFLFYFSIQSVKKVTIVCSVEFFSIY